MFRAMFSNFCFMQKITSLFFRRFLLPFLNAENKHERTFSHRGIARGQIERKQYRKENLNFYPQLRWFIHTAKENKFDM